LTNLIFLTNLQEKYHNHLAINNNIWHNSGLATYQFLKFFFLQNVYLKMLFKNIKKKKKKYIHILVPIKSNF